MELTVTNMQLSAGSTFLAFTGLYMAYHLLSVLIAYLSQDSRYLRSQPWVGLKPSWFAKFRASISSITATRDMVHEGYQRFSQNNKQFALPQFTAKSYVMIPPSKIRTLLSKSDDEVDIVPVMRDVSAAYWNGDEDITGGHELHFDVVRHQLTRNLPLFTSDIHLEVEEGFKSECHAVRGDWITIDALQTCMKVIGRAANRVFSGADLCHNEKFLLHTRLYAQGIFASGEIIKTTPAWLRPIVAPPVVWWARRHLNICKTIARPEIESRLKAIHGGTQKKGADALDWIIENAIACGDPAELRPDQICRRLVRLNMVAIHTTSISIANTLLDLYSSPRVDEFVEGLREECERVLAKHGGQWTKAAVNDMIRIDSCIKESMRFSSLALIGIMREVITDDGVDLGDGIHLPKGVRVGTPNVAIHSDPKIYADPESFDAFRFAKNRDDLSEKKQVVQMKGQALTATGEHFIAFGHGRHACPGRFFASQEMKLMLAHVVMNYDVKLPGLRPLHLDVNYTSSPPSTAKLMVRPRE